MISIPRRGLRNSIIFSQKSEFNQRRVVVHTSSTPSHRSMKPETFSKTVHFVPDAAFPLTFTGRTTGDSYDDRPTSLRDNVELAMVGWQWSISEMKDSPLCTSDCSSKTNRVCACVRATYRSVTGSFGGMWGLYSGELMIDKACMG